MKKEIKISKKKIAEIKNSDICDGVVIYKENKYMLLGIKMDPFQCLVLLTYNAETVDYKNISMNEEEIYNTCVELVKKIERNPLKRFISKTELAPLFGMETWKGTIEKKNKKNSSTESDTCDVEQDNLDAILNPKQ